MGPESTFDPGGSQGRCFVNHRVSNSPSAEICHTWEDNISGFAISGLVWIIFYFFVPHRAFLSLVMKIKEKKKAEPSFSSTVN